MVQPNTLLLSRRWHETDYCEGDNANNRYYFKDHSAPDFSHVSVPFTTPVTPEYIPPVPQPSAGFHTTTLSSLKIDDLQQFAHIK
jgi:hypothetical protein